MTATLPQTTSSQTLTLAPSLPDRLNELLASGESPVVGPETAGMLTAYAEQPEPPLASKAQVEVMIGKLALATAQPKVSEAEASARIELYWLALNDVPVDDLRQGFADLVKTAKFLPTPAEVRTAAMKFAARRKYLKSRARHLAWKHRTEWRPEPKLLEVLDVSALLPDLSAGRNDQ